MSTSTKQTNANTQAKKTKEEAAVDVSETNYVLVMNTVDSKLQVVQPWNNQAALRHFVYDNLFSKVKFVESKEYNDPTNRIAKYVMKAMGVPKEYKTNWWNEGKDVVKRFISVKQLAVLQNLWIAFKGECGYRLYDQCYLNLTRVHVLSIHRCL